VVELGDLCFERFVSHTLPHLMNVRQTAPQARLVGFPSHREMSVGLCGQSWGRPRHANVAGRFPCPRALRSAHRPNATRRVFVGSRAQARFASRLTTTRWTRSASARCWQQTTTSSMERLRYASPCRRGFTLRSHHRSSPEWRERGLRTARMLPPWGPPSSRGSVPPSPTPRLAATVASVGGGAGLRRGVAPSDVTIHGLHFRRPAGRHTNPAKRPARRWLTAHRPRGAGRPGRPHLTPPAGGAPACPGWEGRGGAPAAVDRLGGAPRAAWLHSRPRHPASRRPPSGPHSPALSGVAHGRDGASAARRRSDGPDWSSGALALAALSRRSVRVPLT
jgi:hypothetical protein